jgi:hypothetical protein
MRPLYNLISVYNITFLEYEEKRITYENIYLFIYYLDIITLIGFLINRGKNVVNNDIKKAL